MKKLLSVLLVIAMMLALVACGGAETPAEPETPAAPADPAPGGDPVDVDDPAEAPAIKRGGTLVLGKAKNLDAGMNIAKETDCSSGYTFYAAIFEGLFTVDKDGKPAPFLAESWEFAEDNLSLTIKLREDVSFSNGEKFNAEAAAKCLNYYILDETKHPVKNSDLKLVTGTDVVDEYTIRINTSAPDSNLCLGLASSSGYMVAPAAIDSGDIGANPIGTGPFIVDEYVEGQYVTVKRNPNYYKMGEDGQPLPYLDGIKYIIMTDDTTQITNLKSGEVMGIDRLSSASSTLTAQGMENMNVFMGTVTNVYTVSVNLTNETMQNEKLRQAIMYGIDGQQIIDIAFEGFGAPAKFWTDPGKWYYNEYNPYSYDPEKAAALLAEAGYPDGIELELKVISREPDNTCAQLVQAQLAEVGINIVINQMDTASWVAAVRTDHDCQLSLSLAGNAGYEPARMHGGMFSAFGGNGDGNENIPEVARMYELVNEMKTTIDLDKRIALYDEFQRLIMDTALTAPMGHKYTYAAFDKAVMDRPVNFRKQIYFARSH